MDENREGCDCHIDCHVNSIVKAQKSMKDIVKIVHQPSVVQSELYEAMRILFVLFHGYVFNVLYSLIWTKTLSGAADTEQRMLSVSSWYSPKGDKLLNEVIICIFFAYKKYSRRFITVRLNHWWQMDYFDDVFHTFLGLDNTIYLAVNGTVTSLLVSSKIS